MGTMKFHAETLKGHGLYVTVVEGNRVVASAVVTGTFTERNLTRVARGHKLISRVERVVQKAFSFAQ